MAKAPEDQVLEDIDKEMDDLIDKIFRYSQEKLVEDGKIDTGTLLKSGNVQHNFLHKTITYSVIYADIVEYGRLPGSQPPVDAIAKWVRRKLGVSNEKKAKGIAWAIAKAIKKRGIQPSPYLRPAIDKAWAEA